ncbi:hypothetical protein [Paracoccus sp. (in: a-proteobacteria)]|uniref:hypothetical protein n=1 Tax=Paracoccus sp. TaxID=267 RepID=UPI002AFEFC5F|nr:hypothetical protein [Paracoccus sp. (in: a-proteobacteria)]
MSEALDRLIEAVGRGDDTAVQSIAKGISSAAIDEGRYWPSHDAMKAYRGSLDAAVALKDALLPADWIAEVDTAGFAMVYQDEMELTKTASALLPGLPARALLLAILRAAQREA